MLEPQPGGQAVCRKAAMDVAQDVESFVRLAALMEDARELHCGIGVTRLMLQGRSQRGFVAFVSQHVSRRGQQPSRRDRGDGTGDHRRRAAGADGCEGRHWTGQASHPLRLTKNRQAHGLRLPELGRGKTHVHCQVYVGRQPELGLAIGMGNVDMDSRLFPREKEESELPVANDGPCHVNNVADAPAGALCRCLTSELTGDREARARSALKHLGVRVGTTC